MENNLDNEAKERAWRERMLYQLMIDEYREQCNIVKRRI